MAMKVLHFDSAYIAISAENQIWTEEDFKLLRENYDIIYNGGEVGFWITKSDDLGTPYFHIVTQNGGYLSWNIRRDRKFSIDSLDNWKDVIENTQKHISNNPTKFKYDPAYRL